MIPQTLGHYRVHEQIGAGGMGEVYRATDTRLGREVALKVLPDEFARDPERLARFQQEARVLAALNHANIATIHGLEESDGIRCLVMELVVGGTLAERLAGRLHASLDYGQVDEILSEDPHTYLDGIGRYCTQIHAAAYQSYISYPIESALPA